MSGPQNHPRKQRVELRRSPIMPRAIRLDRRRPANSRRSRPSNFALGRIGPKAERPSLVVAGSNRWFLQANRQGSATPANMEGCSNGCWTANGSDATFPADLQECKKRIFASSRLHRAKAPNHDSVRKRGLFGLNARSSRPLARGAMPRSFLSWRQGVHSEPVRRAWPGPASPRRRLARSVPMPCRWTP